MMTLLGMKKLLVVIYKSYDLHQSDEEHNVCNLKQL